MTSGASTATLPRKVFAMSAPSRRIPSLDGLRGLSIWAVMLAHASAHFVRSPLLAHRLHDIFSPLAYFGVTTFFVISGFLITSLLLKEEVSTQRIDLGRFYRRRATRILPAALFYITVVLLLANVSVSQAVYALTFTTSYFFDRAALPLQQLWSLSVEEQFYMLWPLLFCFGNKVAKRSCWMIVFASPVIRLMLKHYGYAQSAHLAPAIADSLAIGCLLAFYQTQVRAFARRHLVATPVFLTLCASTVLLGGIVYRWDVVSAWGIVPCLQAVMISTAIERKDRILNAGPLVWSGLVSYSLYLWQQPFLVFDGPLNSFPVRTALTCLMAYLSYRVIEQPALNFFTPRRNVPSPAGALT